MQGDLSTTLTLEVYCNTEIPPNAYIYVRLQPYNYHLLDRGQQAPVSMVYSTPFSSVYYKSSLGAAYGGIGQMFTPYSSVNTMDYDEYSTVVIQLNSAGYLARGGYLRVDVTNLRNPPT
jgi:hypothetical protein